MALWDYELEDVYQERQPLLSVKSALRREELRRARKPPMPPMPTHLLPGGLEGLPGYTPPMPPAGLGEIMSRLGPLAGVQQELAAATFGKEGFQLFNPPPREELLRQWAETPEPFPGAKGGLELLMPGFEDITLGGALAGDIARGGARATSGLLRIAKNILAPTPSEVMKVSPSIMKVAEYIRGLTPEIAMQKALRRPERGRRIGEAMDVLQAEPTWAGLTKAKEKLGGALPKVGWAGKADYFTPEEINELLTMVVKYPFRKGKYPLQEVGEQGYENINAADALRRLLGMDEEGRVLKGGVGEIISELPRPFEQKLLEEVFGEPFVQAILSKRGMGAKAWAAFRDGLGIPKSIKASYDASAPFRQAIVLVTEPAFWKSMPDMFRAMANPKTAEAIYDAMISHPRYDDVVGDGYKQMRVSLTKWGPGARLAEREEMFYTKWASKIPGVAASERAFVTFLNKVRFDMALNQLKKMDEAGVSPETYQKVGAFLNAATGRGDIGKLEGLAEFLNAGFWSPRFVASRFQAPMSLFSKDPYVRKLAAREFAGFLGTGAGILTLLDFTDIADVELDPRSSDFGKVRIGPLSYDFWGGYQQVVRLVYQGALATGKALTGKGLKGEYKTASGAVYETGLLDTVARFLQSKMAPGPSLVGDVARGETIIGEPMEATPEVALRELRDLFAPMFLEDVYDAMGELGITGPLYAIPSALGVGVQIYHTLPTIRDKVANEIYGVDFDALRDKPIQAMTVDRQARERLGKRVPSESDKIWDKYNEQVEARARMFLAKEIPGSQFMDEYNDLVSKRSSEIRATMVEPLAEAPKTPLEQRYQDYVERLSNLALTGEQRAELAQSEKANLSPEELQYFNDKELANIARLPVQARDVVRRMIQDKRLLEPYWKVREDTMKELGFWDAYRGLTPLERQKADLYDPNLRVISEIVERRRKVLKIQNPELDRVLSTWYGRKPIFEENIESK